MELVWSPLPVMMAFACWMLLYLTTKSQLQERWYFADLAWRSTLLINRKCCVFYISSRSYIHPTLALVTLVGKFLSTLCCSYGTTYLSSFPYDIYKLVGKNSSSGPSLGNISHVHEWERQHGEGCPRRSRFFVKCEWHSLWYPTLVAGAVPLSDRGRWLHESSYLYGESSGSAKHLLLIAKRNNNDFMWVKSTGVQWSEIVMIWKACNMDYIGKP